MSLIDMFDDVLGSWLGLIGGYFQSAPGIFAGTLQPDVILPAVGIACLVIGIVLVAIWRERQALWMLPLVGLAIITFPVLALANTMAGWLGMALAILVGAALLLVAIGLVSGEATRRLPIWLIGAFAFTFAAYSSLPSLAYIFGGI
jgi:hypothetical protein